MMTTKKRAARLNAFVDEGILAHQAGNLEEAEVLYRKVLTANPDHARALQLLGVIALQVGKPEKSLELITRAIEIDPEDASFYCNLGNTQKILGLRDKAIASFQEAVSLSPYQSYTHNNLGVIFQENNLFEDAFNSYDKAIIINPQDAGAHTRRGLMLQKMGRNENAAESYRKALTINPDYADAKTHLESLPDKSGGGPLEAGGGAVPFKPRASSNCNLLIATIPRSGTHYIEQIFHALAEFCPLAPGMDPIEKFFPAPHVASYPNLGIGVFCVGHAAFPNFEEALDGDQLKKWHTLSYFHPGHDSLLKSLKVYPKYVEVLKSSEGFDFNDKNSRIVFIYRNPLDHFISFYNSRMGHVDFSTRGYYDKNGKFIFFENYEDFIFKGGLDSYLKLYASYAWSMPKYSDRIMMISYESFIKAPKAAISNILDFIDSAPDPRLIPNELDLAVACSAPRFIKLLEKDYDVTLGMDRHPTSKHTSHIFHGGTGTWRNLIDRDAIRKIEYRFNEFGFTLNDFDIGADLDELLSGEKP